MLDRQGALSLLASETSFGRDFFSTAARALTLGLGCRWGAIGRLSDAGDTAYLLALHGSENGGELDFYPLPGSPCETVYGDGPDDGHRFYADGLAGRFPDSRMPVGRQALTYRGAALRDAAGSPMGHIFAMGEAPDADDAGAGAFFDLVRRRAEAEFARWRSDEGARLTQFTVDRAGDMILWFGPEGRIEYANDIACHTLGYAAAELTAMAIADIDPDVDPNNWPRIWPRIRKRSPYTFETELRARTGAMVPIETSVFYLRHADREIACSFSRDIAQRRHAEQELRATKERAEMANHAKTNFLANMSHELRTPLNAVIAFSEIIRTERFGPIQNAKYRDYAGDIYSSGRHLLDLINDLLDLAKVESGTEAPDEMLIDVPAAVRSVHTLVKERSSRGKVTLEIDILDGLPSLRADGRRLKQILVNLLSNGIKFTPSGGRVSLGVSLDGDGGFLFRVADTGIGIAAADLPTALAQFGQVPHGRTYSRGNEGTGLGLPLAKALVEMHGGSLALQSKPGAGTTVTVRFPEDRTEWPKGSRRASSDPRRSTPASGGGRPPTRPRPDR